MKNIISFQNNVITKLKKKLKKSDEIVIEKDKLQISVNEFELWREKNDVCRKKVFDELISSFEDQSEKLKTAICVESDWQAKYTQLQDSYDSVINQLKTLKSKENNLKSKLEDADQNIQCLQKELRYTKVNNNFFVVQMYNFL